MTPSSTSSGARSTAPTTTTLAPLPLADTPLFLVRSVDQLAGRAFDAVVLHTFFTDETVLRAVDGVRTAAEQAYRESAGELSSARAAAAAELAARVTDSTAGRATGMAATAPWSIQREGMFWWRVMPTFTPEVSEQYRKWGWKHWVRANSSSRQGLSGSPWWHSSGLTMQMSASALDCE